MKAKVKLDLKSLESLPPQESYTIRCRGIPPNPSLTKKQPIVGFTRDKDIHLEESEENCTLFRKYLQNDQILADDFELYWVKCAPLRFKQIANSKTTNEIFNLWPYYIKPFGIHLIDRDFALKFPMAKDFHESWSQFGDKVLCLLKSKMSNDPEISKQLHDIDSKNEESKMFMIFWFMHNLLPPQQETSTESSGSDIRKKYSIVDSQKAFAIIAATDEEMEAKLNMLKQQCQNIPPKLLIVGEIYNIKSIFVYIDDIKYPSWTFLRALDALLKTFLLFNLPYPEESDVFYNFIQTFLYDLPSRENYDSVSTIIHDILQFKS